MAARTLVEIGTERLVALSRALGFKNESRIPELFCRLVTPWGQRPRLSTPLWPSQVGDDGTPFEFSVAFDGRTHLRILFEPLGNTPSLHSNWDATMALLSSFSNEQALHLGRLHRIQDLFFPRADDAVFSAWVAVEVSAHGAPAFRIYLNPEANGRTLAPNLVEEALVRLGFGSAWPVIGRTLLRRGPELDELKYFSLDLSSSPEARVKVYARHRNATVEDLELAALGCPTQQHGDVTQFVRKVAPGIDRFDGRAPLTCYAFVEGSDTPAGATTHFPVNGYGENDELIAQRVTAAFEGRGIPTEPYVRSLEAFANRPLAERAGLHAYASFRRHKGKPRGTVYLSVEAYAPGVILQPTPLVEPGTLVELLQNLDEPSHIEWHPFSMRLQRHTQTRTSSALLGNLEAFLSGSLTATVTHLLEPIADEELRAVLSQRLAAQSPSAGTQKVSRKVRLDSPELAPATALDRRLSELLASSDLYTAIGARLAAVAFQRQVMNLHGEQLWGRAPLAPSSRNAKAAVPPIGPRELAAMWRGVSAFRQAEWGFLNELYLLCFVPEVQPDEVTGAVRVDVRGRVA